MSLQKPNKIALCLVGGNSTRNQEQIELLGDLFNRYEIEVWSRADKGTSNYHSFSQLINEAVCDTEAEFMIFMNPKTNPSVELIESILEGLCSGFCWVGKVSFGLFGATKELFRHVGLMDEMFIGGEYEDDDFGLRLKKFGKAIDWEFNWKMYPWTDSPLGNYRGISRGHFKSKWYEVEENLYALNPRFASPKRLPKRIQDNWQPEISDSWMDWDMSRTDWISHVAHRTFNAQFLENVEFEEIRVPAEYHVNISDGTLRFFFWADTDTEASFQLANAVAGQEMPLTDRKELQSNHWYSDGIQLDQPFEIRIFQGGNVVFYDRFATAPYDILLRAGAVVYKPILP